MFTLFLFILCWLLMAQSRAKLLFFMLSSLLAVVVKSNLSLYLRYYTEACKELVVPNSASLRPGNTQLLSKKCRSDGEPLVTLFPIWPVQDLNLRPSDPETNVLPLDQQTSQTKPCQQNPKTMPYGELDGRKEPQLYMRE